ncbi:glycosyltransferase involved in cell wall biosynthesis [Actinoplanes campanulatus]|uniref:Glycosyltransferase involved in cell wall biosynthesis n=1 Tax=Actinoplanes campanulatus TaxID=113559 RepID=A0A7W5ASC5_9ACTN|nr:hypothetical protein [Actinoplanes campanulatus]MBB3101553.1 glycosyltransferase involved in cell wall biosynthesis [Actinoplanes campanulatus]GGN51437.1 hypothetical protein GCM10010109_91540 [Actinoplanes campanulatus]GID42616.1 hypothetical protein Aca09nite_91220 [Actinoplanes campanulatus]
MTSLAVLPDVGELHHESHAGLLDDEEIPDDPTDFGLDAIIVPTASMTDALRHVIQVGREIDCPVVALCSRDASAVQAWRIAQHEAAALMAVDVDHTFAGKLPSFATDRQLRNSGFAGASDLSLKRNLGLALARGSGWRRVLFLDDDIHIDEPEQLHRVAGLVDRYRAVGLANHGFADNSVVCHAYRAVGGAQDSFIGGGAMIVDAARTGSFFPNIYNEDWFFLLGDGVPFTAARSGAMRQRTYNPFANPARAAAEELGDTLAEGLFWLLDTGEHIDVASSASWGDALFRRRMFIDLIIGMTGPADDRMRRSLLAGRGRSAEITHGFCRDFVEIWQADLQKWRDYLAWVPISSGPKKFLYETGMSYHVLFSEAFTAR